MNTVSGVRIGCLPLYDDLGAIYCGAFPNNLDVVRAHQSLGTQG
jgi:hypothetical protein